MTSPQDYIGNPWWGFTYDRYSYHDPSHKGYIYNSYSALNEPITIDSNEYYTIQLTPFHGGNSKTYDIGTINQQSRRYHKEINLCNNITGNPVACADKYTRRNILRNPYNKHLATDQD